MKALLISLVGAALFGAPKVNLYSFEKETAVGRELAKGLEKHFTIVQSAAVDEVGAQLLSTMPDLRFQVTFRVFESDKVQARQIPAEPVFPQNLETVGFLEPLVLPGGFIFVPSRMVKELSRDELAAGLAHALAHVQLRHCTVLASRSELVQRAAASVPNQMAGNPTMQEPLGMQKYARAFELEADKAAIPILEHVGFSKNALRSYLEKLPPLKRVMRVSLSSSPSPEERLATIN